MIRTAALAALLCLSTAAHAALTRPGDLAFTSFNADEDGFALVTLAPIGPGTAVYFTDNEWPGGMPGTASFTAGESALRWVSGDRTIAPGTVVRFSAIDQAGRAASIGSLSVLEGTSLGFAATGDTLFAYTGITPRVPLVFLAAISSEGFAGSSLDGTGLEVGTSAITVVAGADFAQYVGPRTGLTDFSSYRALVNDAARWSGFATGTFAATAPDLTPFTTGTVAAVPEPETYAMLLVGLAAVGMQLRRHRRCGHPLPDRLSAPGRATPALPSARAGC